MYMLESMIDMGLANGKEWPSNSHRVVAQTILLNNPNITSRDKLTSGVEKILSIPMEEIETVTLQDLYKYGFTITTNIDI